MIVRPIKTYSLVFIGALSLLLLMSSCIYDPTDPFFYDNLFNRDLEFCKKFLNRYFLFRDLLPENDSIFTTTISLFDSIDEPYTRYLTGDTAQEFHGSLTTKARGKGLGIEYDSVANGVVITYLYPNAPGAGVLQPGDTILVVNGDTLAGVTMAIAGLYLGAWKSDNKIMTIKRDTVVLDTAVIQEYAIPSVYIDSIDTALAYMFIASFLDSTNTAGGTAAEIKNALGRMQWAETVIIDIRDNLGGNFNQCLDAVSHFIAAGAAIIITSDWNIDSIKVSTWLVSDATLRGTKTYLLLVNDSTAGAAELFASALKENKVATLITGVNTYGFGYKQIMAFTPDSNCVIATNGRVISLSGDTLHETGITPTDPVSVNEDALENVLEEIGGGAAQYQEAYIRISSLREKHYSRNRTFPLCFIPEN